VEEKAWIAAEKIQKAKDREEMKLKKAEVTAQKAKERASKKVAPSARARQQETAAGDNMNGEAGPSIAAIVTKQKQRACCLSQTSKRPRLDESDCSDRCCVCFQTFEEDIQQEAGVDWVKCSCMRWLHEDCIVDCITDSSGKERLCPYCT